MMMKWSYCCKFLKQLKNLDFSCWQSIAFLCKKILFKQSNGLISVIQTLFHWKQWLRGFMLTLNTVIQTQMMLNDQVTQIRQLSQKTRKTPQTYFADHKLKLCEVAEELLLSFCLNIYQWESCVQSGWRVCSQLIKNNMLTIQSIVRNC